MTDLSHSRSGLDSLIYWTVFVLLSCFVTFFLNSMIDLANAEEHQYQNDTSVGNSISRTRLHSHQNTAVTDSLDMMEDGVDDTTQL